MTIIYHHLGLGDHIICNGLVREIIKKDENEKYFLCTKSHNLESVKFMYSDIENLNFLTVINEPSDIDNYIKDLKPSKVIFSGSIFSWPENSKTWEEVFFNQHGLDLNTKWDSFKCNRNNQNEKKLFDYFNVKENNYVFIHDDIDRGFLIDENYIINKDLKIIRPVKGLTDNIFDYCYLIENSYESHFIDSSFKLMTDVMSLKKYNIFHHIKNNGNIIRSDVKSSSKLNFKIIE